MIFQRNEKDEFLFLKEMMLKKKSHAFAKLNKDE